MTIATIAANVAAALGQVTMANDAASVVKFDALVTFAAGVAQRVRVEHVNTGANLETDAKGRVVAVVDTSKQQRTALVAALIGAGVKDKDAANIASMGRSLALFAVPLMIDDGSLHDAPSGERMRQIIEETILSLTHGKDTYNALERLRGNKWQALAVEAPATDEGDDSAPIGDVDLDATLDTAPASAEGASEAEPEANPDDVLNAEVSNALRVLTSALERDDIERIVALGGRHVAFALSVKLTEWASAQEAQRAEEEALALEAKAQAKRAKA